MIVVLNILAALLLTVLPALKPCDCNGFSFVCACALDEAGAKSRVRAAAAEPNCCCCRKSHAPEVDESGQLPKLPAPRKHGGCLKFAVHQADFATADLIPMQSETLPMVAAPLPEFHFSAPVLAPSTLHRQRPPPYGLIVAHLRRILI